MNSTANKKSTKPKFLTTDDIRGMGKSVHAKFKKGTLVLDKKMQAFSGFHVDLIVDWREKCVWVSMKHGGGIGISEYEGHEWSTRFDATFCNPYIELKYSAAEIQDFVLDVAREINFLLATIDANADDDSDVPDDIKDLIKRALAPAAFTAYTNDNSEVIQQQARKKIAAIIDTFSGKTPSSDGAITPSIRTSFEGA